MKSLRNKDFHRAITIILLVVSIIFLAMTPFEELKDDFFIYAPGIIISLGVTEFFFVTGLIIMAIVAGYDLGLNPLRWKSHFKKLPHHIMNQRAFWIGFWINAVGAFGTGLVIFIGVITVLPVETWGLLYLALFDIGLTLALRTEILRMKNIENQN